MAKRTLHRILRLAGLGVLTFGMLGAAGFARPEGSALAAGRVGQSTASETPPTLYVKVKITSISKVGASTASAAPKSPRASGPTGPCVMGNGASPATAGCTQIDYCLAVSFTSVHAIDTNTVQPKGTVTNDCSYTVTSGRLDLYGYVQCSGASADGHDYTNLTSLSPGSTQLFQAAMTGYCEVCQNGVPVDWPPFTIVSQAAASGQGPNGILVETINDPTWQTSLSNSPGASIPCP